MITLEKKKIYNRRDYTKHRAERLKKKREKYAKGKISVRKYTRKLS